MLRNLPPQNPVQRYYKNTERRNMGRKMLEEIFKNAKKWNKKRIKQLKIALDGHFSSAVYAKRRQKGVWQFVNKNAFLLTKCFIATTSCFFMPKKRGFRLRVL